ncbi:MAG: sensor histidine kinase [Pseudobutyrivibrio sp.]|uniref:sensor histidine kinase n=1 Tax=Pseudobutyrivibrio sp. TaxID=2014367 RepID=UPI0025EA7F7A|nr:sensor histidine kinase [Pseudobutyrivibrio sp.]MBQ8488950.1 sensor histidine kinase [Pseudobutyrivibrio sp.]
MLKKLLMNRSLKARIVILYTIFTIAVVGIMTYYAYHFMFERLKETEHEAINDSVAYLEQIIESRIESINEEYINNFDNSDFINLYLQSNYVNGNVSKQVEVQNVYKDYFLEERVRNSDIIYAIELMGKDKTVYADTYSPELNYNEFQESTIFETLMNKKNKIHYLDYDQDSKYFVLARSFYFDTDNSPKISLPVAGYNSDKNEDYSSLIFVLKKDYLKKLINKEAKKRELGIYVTDQNNNIVVKAGNFDWCNRADISNILTENESTEYLETKISNHDVGVYQKGLAIMDWNLVYIYDLNALYQEAGGIRKVALIIFIFSMLSLIIIASVISDSVVKPIKILSQSMDDAIENNLEVRFNFKYNDEVAKLGNSFTVLMFKIHSLMDEVKMIEQQKRAEEMKALQAQINPHFLYNTLDTVYWLAKIDGNDKVAQMVLDLADLFRLSLNKGEDITTVKRELEHVQKYLDIQKIRMVEKFDYEINVDKSLYECRIPKLILQPFVENSLLHGFENIGYKGKVIININSDENTIYFKLRDNGKGIDKEQLQKINGGEYESDDNHGYAIKNVRERIVLYTKEGYGVYFDEAASCGTQVCISFPKNYKQ